MCPLLPCQRLAKLRPCVSSIAVLLLIALSCTLPPSLSVCPWCVCLCVPSPLYRSVLSVPLPSSLSHSYSCSFLSTHNIITTTLLTLVCFVVPLPPSSLFSPLGSGSNLFYKSLLSYNIIYVNNLIKSFESFWSSRLLPSCETKEFINHNKLLIFCASMSFFQCRASSLGNVKCQCK